EIDMLQPKFSAFTSGGAVVLAALLLSVGLSGCEEEANTTLLSPVQAVTTLVERHDGRVEAELVLISTSVDPHEFVDTADNVTVRVPGSVFVGLMRTSGGHYTMDSTMNAELTYVENETYQFRFDLEDETAQQVSGGNFVAVMTAPAGDVEFTITAPPQFAGDTATITWTPITRYGLLRVTDANDVTVYENFDFNQPQFNGSKWARLKTGGTDVLGVDVFNVAGDYTIHFCGVDKTSGFEPSLSAELGVLSGFLIGKCAEPQTITVPN
ncbi:MAG: hypothetical protein OEN20_13680, partial [Gammaproteobacteria bacterium]|nr:hypothetical protein [Gammaproteobacteria bacterium]